MFREDSSIDSQPPPLSRHAVLRILSFILITSYFLLHAAPLTLAQESPSGDPVRSAQDSLTRGSRCPWYDRRKDDVRRLNIVPRQSIEDRGDHWADTTKPKTPFKWPRFTVLGEILQW